MLSDTSAIARLPRREKRSMFVYRSQNAGTSKATAVTLVTDEVEDLVRTLKRRGVTFEHYALPGPTLPPTTAERETVSASARSRA